MCLHCLPAAGYALAETAPSGDALLWFYVLGPHGKKQTSNQGPLQLVAREAYRWQGVSID